MTKWPEETKRRARETRARRRLWNTRSAAGLCWNCGGNEWVDAVDNDGDTYKGCARCVIGPLPVAIGSFAETRSRIETRKESAS